MDRSSQLQMQKILAPSANSTSAIKSKDIQYYGEKPMMLNVWTQTNSEDFNDINDLILIQNKKQTKIKELSEKIRLLENSLRIHSDFIAQFSPTDTEHQSTPTTLKRSPNQLSVINPLQPVPPLTESVNYTIVADGRDCTIGEPIEILLAEEDGALNLNNSTDSGRLELCLSEVDEMKAENLNREYTLPVSNTSSFISVSPPITTSTKGIKRRKILNEPELTNCCNDKTIVRHNYKRNNVTNLEATTSQICIKTSKFEGSTIKKGLPMQPKPNICTPPTSQQKIDIIDNVMVSIGPNNTRIPAKLYENMSWTSASIATRKLLMAIFDRKTLATHSMTGKPSPAFKDHGKPLKEMLDPLIVQDIIFAVTRKCSVSDKEVRNAITTKCADENKMMKLQMNKSRSLREINKENVV